MLRPVKSGGFDSPDRTGLLWALEVIAWNEAHLFRVARVLARLCDVPINDNWVNKPETSMESMVRSWLPQTAANIDQRLDRKSVEEGQSVSVRVDLDGRRILQKKKNKK